MKNTKSSLQQIAELYVLDLIRDEHPEWVKENGSCPRCEQYYQHLDDLIAYDEVYD